MTMTKARFAEMRPPIPDSVQLAGAYEQLIRRAESCETDEERNAFVADWQKTRNSVATWCAIARLRFKQNTGDAAAKAGNAQSERLTTELTGLDARVKEILLSEATREEWERLLGAQAIALWGADVSAFDPSIEEALVEEKRLCSEYVALTGSAKFDIGGERLNMSGVMGLAMKPERETRHEAEKARWGWFAENREQLDSLYDQLVRGRDKMARKLGHDNFVKLGYARMHRVDYDKNDVEGFRSEVREKLVPLCAEIAKQQARDLGIGSLRYWDEKMFGKKPPVPQGNHDWMIERASEMFGSMSSDLSRFYEMMIERNLLDLDGRNGKALGGFCTYFHDYKVPFIYANFNGTRGDVRVFTHEMGHAFQRYSSSNLPLADYVGCTSESAEVHSMSLEFLAWPEMERFFGEDADAFRRVHLLEQLLFLPYGVAIDHFQHEVYENPNATPDERFAMWKRMEATYLPWRNFGDLPHVSDGGFWQYQLHVFLYPFYYIDYTLAATCALQFWARSQDDYDGAMKEYVQLCRRGGTLPFRQMTASAGLTSPFDEGCLDAVIETARTFLEI